MLDAGDVLSLLRQLAVDVVLAGHRHVPYVWPVAGMLLVHSGTVATLRRRQQTCSRTARGPGLGQRLIGSSARSAVPAAIIGEARRSVAACLRYRYVVVGR